MWLTSPLAVLIYLFAFPFSRNLTEFWEKRKKDLTDLFTTDLPAEPSRGSILTISFRFALMNILGRIQSNNIGITAVCSLKYQSYYHICPNSQQRQDSPFVWIYYIFDKCSQGFWCGVIFVDPSQICVVESWTASRKLFGNLSQQSPSSTKGIYLFGPSRGLLAITGCFTSKAGKHHGGLLRLH